MSLEVEVDSLFLAVAVRCHQRREYADASMTSREFRLDGPGM